jgi:hypothetical protein
MNRYDLMWLVGATIFAAIEWRIIGTPQSVFMPCLFSYSGGILIGMLLKGLR